MFGKKTNEIDLGDIAKDEITGCKGTVVAITAWIHACKRVTLQPNELKDGLPIDNYTFDMPQLTLVSKANEKPESEMSKTGGPSITPKRSTDPI